MTTTVQSIVDKAQIILQDTSAIRWPESELVSWVNHAQRAIVLIKPDARATNETVTLVTGSKQSIPSGGNRLLSVIRNMSAASGGNGGRTIRIVDKEVLDAQAPSWHDPAATGLSKHGTSVKHYVYEESDPRTFYVYPGVAGNAYCEIVYSANPAAVTISDNIGLPDLYSVAIMNYVIYMAYMKDADFAGHQQRAASHFQLFMTSVSGKSQLDILTSPNSERPDPTLNPMMGN